VGVTFENYYKMPWVRLLIRLRSWLEDSVKDSKVWANRLAPSVKLIMEVITDPSMALFLLRSWLS